MSALQENIQEGGPAIKPSAEQEAQRHYEVAEKRG